MRKSPAEFKKNAISGICWFVGFICLFQVIFWLMTNVWIQDFWDAQYVLKTETLEKSMAEKPGQPLWLIMGSSTVEDGVCAGLLNTPETPLVFNYGMGGADLFRQMICLRRLLEAGIKPQRVGIEVLGALMNIPESGFSHKEDFIVRARRDELDVYSQFSIDPSRVRHLWMKSRFNPASVFGVNLPPHTFSWSSFPRFWRAEKPPYDEWGWLRLQDPGGAAHARKLADEKAIYKAQYFDDVKFGVSGFTDRVLREILEICKKENIGVFIFRMPESPDFQKIYPAEANAAIDTYLSRFVSETGIPFIDGRSWVEESGFDDGHHLAPDGAEEFTKRMGQELLRWQNGAKQH
ncbi:MAG: hypothetical protein WCD79_00680 [Chthoniobacteraceae bacterium]